MYKREREVVPTLIWEHIPVYEQDTRGRGGIPRTCSIKAEGGEEGCEGERARKGGHKGGERA